MQMQPLTALAFDTVLTVVSGPKTKYAYIGGGGGGGGGEMGEGCRRGFANVGIKMKA